MGNPAGGVDSHCQCSKALSRNSQFRYEYVYNAPLIYIAVLFSNLWMQRVVEGLNCCAVPTFLSLSPHLVSGTVKMYAI